MVMSVTGRTLTYSVDITREINGVQFKCTATSSDTTKYDYSVASGGKYYTVLCELLIYLSDNIMFSTLVCMPKKLCLCNVRFAKDELLLCRNAQNF